MSRTRRRRHTGPRTFRGSAFGLLAAIQSVGNFAASGIAGILWTAISPTAAWTYPAAWMALALIGMLTTATARPST